MRIVPNGNGATIEFVTDDQGYVDLDIRCPVSCGACCDFWKDVPSVAFGMLTEAILGPAYAECPHLTERGCRLPRKKRPIECTSYLCELAKLALEDLVSEEEIQKTIEKAQQNDAFTYLGKCPKIKECKSKKEVKFRPSDQRKLKKIVRARD